MKVTIETSVLQSFAYPELSASTATIYTGEPKILNRGIRDSVKVPGEMYTQLSRYDVHSKSYADLKILNYGLEYVTKRRNEHPDWEVTITTESGDIYNTLSNGFKNWDIDNNWFAKADEPTDNIDEWKTLVSQLKKLNAKLELADADSSTRTRASHELSCILNIASNNNAAANATDGDGFVFIENVPTAKQREIAEKVADRIHAMVNYRFLKRDEMIDYLEYGNVTRVNAVFLNAEQDTEVNEYVSALLAA